MFFVNNLYLCNIMPPEQATVTVQHPVERFINAIQINTMEITNKYMRVAYTLYSHRDGECEEVEKTTREQPFGFLTGVGYTLDSFEENLKDLQKGDEFDFTIPFADAYGEYDPDHVQDFDREVFTIDGKFDSAHIYVGNVVEMIDRKSVV